MPITVLCPSCHSRITAPDKLAGKTAKCPKCQTAFVLPSPESVADPGFELVDDDEPIMASPKKKPLADPGFEIVEDDEPVVASSKKKPPVASQGFEVIEDDEPIAAKPRNKARQQVVEEDEDEDSDIDDQPRKGKSRKKASTPKWMYAGIAGAFLLVGLGVGLYFLLGVKGTSWKKFDAPDGSFTTYFPNGEPSAEDIWKIMGDEKAPQDESKRKREMEEAGVKAEGWSRSDGGRKYIVAVVTFPAAFFQFIKQGFEKEGVGKSAFGGSSRGSSLSEDERYSVGLSGQTSAYT